MTIEDEVMFRSKCVENAGQLLINSLLQKVHTYVVLCTYIYVYNTCTEQYVHVYVRMHIFAMCTCIYLAI